MRPGRSEQQSIPLVECALSYRSVSEFERDIIRERTQAGVQAARGRVGGRPKALNPKKASIAQALYNNKNNSIADICKTLNISRATLYRYIKINTQP
jgi:DNA invertase Pin-like site-specific DNA recombinase